MDASPRTAPAPLWRTPSYPTWFVSDTSKELANALTSFALPLIVLAVTDDPAQAGIVAAAGMAVGVVLTLVGGVLADRHRRVALMLLGSLVGVAFAGAFAVLDATGAWTFAVLLALNVLLNTRKGLFDTAGEAALKDIVPDAALGRAQAANQGRGAAVQLAAGPLAGLLLVAGGWLVGVAAALAHAIAAVTAWMLGRRRPHGVTAPAVERPARERFGVELAGGLSWTFARPDLRGVLVAAMIVNLGFNSAIVTTVYALQQDGHAPVSIGGLSAAIGAAMLAGSLLAPLLVPRVPAGVLIIGGLLVASGCVVLLALSSSFWGVLAALAGAVFFVPAVNAGLLGYFMVAVPSGMMGRATSAMQVLTLGAVPLAPLIAGLGLATVGRAGTVILCASLCALAALIALCSASLRSLPVESAWSAHAQRVVRAGRA